jgi:outer membrane protein assembly factor BamA
MMSAFTVTLPGAELPNSVERNCRPAWKAGSRLMIVALLAALALPLKVFPGQEKPPSEAQPASLVVLPVIYYTPETRLAFGAGGIYTFRPKGTPLDGRPSYFQAIAVYTQNRQFALSLEPSLYLKGETLLLTGLLELRKFPDKFWGLGSDTSDSAEEDYTPVQQTLQVTLQKKIIPRANFYVGLAYNFEHYKFLEFKPAGHLASGNIIGGRGGLISGLGLVFSLDSRDNIFFPLRGNYIQVSAKLFNRFLASDYDFFKFRADLRRYYPLWRSHVLALQCLFQATPGTTPFMSLSQLGGDSLMRGYYSGRFRDKVLLAAQAEYRLPLWWRFGLVGFAGMGEVADRISCLSAGRLKYSYGFGFRFRVNSEGARLRLDFAYGKGTSGVYFTAGEAF